MVVTPHPNPTLAVFGHTSHIQVFRQGYLLDFGCRVFFKRITSEPDYVQIGAIGCGQNVALSIFRNAADLIAG